MIPAVHFRIRGSGSQAQFACGVEKRTDPATCNSLAVPINPEHITCYTCRRLMPK